MNPKSQRGFTLIELLVVIAIIGILASVVLASLNSARDKGADAAIKANLANIRAQAQLYYEDNGSSYGTAANCSAGMFAGDDTVANQVAAASSSASGSVACVSDGDNWQVSAQLSSGNYWCVDSTGQATDIGGSASASSTCS